MSELSKQPCFLVAGREAAARAVQRLLEAGIDAEAKAPSARYHGLPADRYEICVAAVEAARARVILLAD